MFANMNGAHSRHINSPEQAQLIDSIMQQLHNDVKKIGALIQQHKKDLKLLQSQRNNIECTILDLRVALGKYYPSPKPMDPFYNKSEEEPHKSVLEHNDGQLKTHNDGQTSGTSGLFAIKDVLGTVATLGKVDDDHLNRLLSEYLGKDLMLAVVCKTFDGVKALKAYDSRSTVICLQQLSPYFGQFFDREPQRRLDILKPQLPDGSPPPGFIGFAVNMIKVDTPNLSGLTSNGLGLRETLFYTLFSNLQVYQTREEMLEAYPLQHQGAISLDGAILKSTGMIMIGDPENADISIKFLKCSGVDNLSVTYYAEMKQRLSELERKKNKARGDMKRLQLLLDNAKGKFEVKNKEFLTFLEAAAGANHRRQPLRSRSIPITQHVGSSSIVPTNQQLGSSSSFPIKLEDD